MKRNELSWKARIGQESRMKTIPVVFLWIILLASLYSTLAIVRHNNFLSAGLDLGLFDQAIWQFAHFVWPYNTIYERFILGDHLNLTLPLVAPLYWLWDDVRGLLVFQAAFLCISTIAIYKLVLLRGLSKGVALSLSLVYSLFYGIQYAAYEDFHAFSIGVGLLAWLAYFVESRNKKGLWITVPLLLLTQENMGFALTGLGMIYLFHPKHRALAWWFILGGIVYALVAIRIVSVLSPIGYEYAPIISLDPLTNITRLIDTPDKRTVWLYSFSSYLFLPLFSPGALLAVTADLSQYYMPGNQYSWMLPATAYHRAILAVFLALGTMDALIFLKKRGMNISFFPYVIIVMTLMFQFVLRLPLTKLFEASSWQTQGWMSDAERLFSRIPRSASLVTYNNFTSHLSHRKEIYLAKLGHLNGKESPCGNDGCWWIETAGQPEYLVVTRVSDEELRKHPEYLDEFQQAIRNMEQKGKITKVDQEGAVVRYRILY